MYGLGMIWGLEVKTRSGSRGGGVEMYRDKGRHGLKDVRTRGGMALEIFIV